VLHSDSARAIVFLDEVSGIPGYRGSDGQEQECLIQRPPTDEQEQEMRPRRITSTSPLDICLQHSSSLAESVRSNISNMSKVDFCPEVDALEDALTKHPRVVAVTRYTAAQCKNPKKDVDRGTEWKMEVCVPKQSSSKPKN
jgi:hypothetical protein